MSDLNVYGWLYVLVQKPYESLVTVPLEKITNIIRWIPTLWKDKNWNGEKDILRILDFKLSLVEECLREDTWHQGAEKVTAEVVEARKCLKRLIEDDYCKKEQIAHDKKYGKLQMLDDGIGSYAKDGSVLTHRVKFTPDSKASNKSRQRIWQLEAKRNIDDWNKFCDILKTKSSGWWT